MKDNLAFNNQFRKIFFFIGMIVYKLATEWGYYYILSVDMVTYPVNFNIWKYINGWIWSIVLFLVIRYDRKKVSVFMLYLLYVSQVIPITCVYALANDSIIYYNLTCFAILYTELLLGWTERKTILKWKTNYSKYIILTFSVVLLFLLIVIFLRNGLPSLKAINIYKVYELRKSGRFQISKYERYLLNWMTGAIIPFLIAKFMEEKKYISAIILCGIVFLLYLYSGHKTYLFSIPLVIICSLWMNKKYACEKLYLYAMYGFALLVVLLCFSPILKELFYKIYQLIGRRVFLVSAVNKFKYYDYFSNNVKLGLSGIFPRWILPIADPYEGFSIPNIISDIYYNKPEMVSNTGFLAEGYMRFGYIGIFVGMWVYAQIVRLMDRMQERVGYSLTVSAFVYPMLMLTDSHLIDSLIFGNYMFIFIILIFYRQNKKILSFKVTRNIV